MYQPMMTPAIPHKMVSQSGMLSRLFGATNLPSRPIMMPATITPMISMCPPSFSCSPNAIAAYQPYPILIFHTKQTCWRGAGTLLQQLPERTKVKIQIILSESEIIAKLSHAVLEEHECASDAFGLFRSHRAGIEPAHRLPFHQLTEQLNQCEYQLHQATLHRFRISIDPAAQRIESAFRDLIE